ncbi:MAG: IS110 family RNA-guided transposase [Thermoplasmataceae archaeon]
MWIGLDIHKRSAYITETKEEGSINQQYEIANSEEAWNVFKNRYLQQNPEIAIEVSSSGKYVARLLRDMGFHVHMADPVKLALIFKSAKKNDKEDSYKLAKLLRLGELPEVHLPSKESDDLRSVVRYRRSLGEEITMIKNRVHALLTRHGILIKATDIFGRSGLMEIERRSSKLSPADRIVLTDMLHRIADLKNRSTAIEDEMARMTAGRKDVKLLMTIPGINVYSTAAIISEIDVIGRFPDKEHLASYAGLTPRQNQSGNTDIRGHISKHGPSMLRFVLVSAAHSAIKYSSKMKAKYLKIVRRLGRNRAIVTIARILLENIFVMLSRGIEFIDNMDGLTEKKMLAMAARARNPALSSDVKAATILLRRKNIRGLSDQPFS